MQLHKIMKYYSPELSDDLGYIFVSNNKNKPWHICVSKDSDDVTVEGLSNISSSLLNLFNTFARRDPKERFKQPKLSWSSVIGTAKHYNYAWNSTTNPLIGSFVKGGTSIQINMKDGSIKVNICMDKNNTLPSKQFLGTIRRYLKDHKHDDVNSNSNSNNVNSKHASIDNNVACNIAQSLMSNKDNGLNTLLAEVSLSMLTYDWNVDFFNQKNNTVKLTNNDIGKLHVKVSIKPKKINKDTKSINTTIHPYFDKDYTPTTHEEQIAKDVANTIEEKIMSAEK